MRITRSVVIVLFFAVILSPLGILNLSVPKVHAQGTTITLGQPVTGTLSQANPEDWWGVNIPRGQVNITLTIPHGNPADLAFSFSPFYAGAPLGETYPSLANTIHNPGSNQTCQFVAPSTDNGFLIPFLVPGPSAIRVFSPSSNYGRTESVTYTLTIVQLQGFTTITAGTLSPFNKVRASTPILYSFNAPTTGAYNITMNANATSSALLFSVSAFENDLYLPLSINNLALGQRSMLIVLSSTATTYLIVTPFINPSPSIIPLKGNVTVAYQSLPVITPGQPITATPTGPATFYLSHLAVGSYYNLTLTPPATMTGRLDVYSPSWAPGDPSSNIASSATPGSGVVQKVRNLVMFYLSSYSYTNSSGYVPIAGPTIPGPRPDKVLIRVTTSGTGSYTLKIDSAPFPQLGPNSPIGLTFSTTKGPYYSFYQAHSGPGSYTESLPFTITNSTVSWSSQIDLDGVIQDLGAFDPNRLLRTYGDFILGATSKTQVQSWPIMNERNFDAFALTRPQNSTLQLGYGTVLSVTPYIGATIGPIFYGNATTKSTLSYTYKATTPIATGTPKNDFLSGLNVNLYTISLTKGTTYRLDDTHTSAGETWALYDPATGLTVPTQGPFLAPGVSTDPNQPLTSDYIYFTAPATGTYYLAAGINPGPLIAGPNPAGLPEEHYTFTVTVASTPPGSTTQLTVTISAPSQATAGQTIKINGTVTNTGSYNANNVAVNIVLPSGLSTSQSLFTTIGTLTPGQSAVFAWNLTVSGSGTVSAGLITSSDNAPQTVKTSTLNISPANQQGPSTTPFFGSTTGVALLTGVLAAIGGLAAGVAVGRKRRPHQVGIGQWAYELGRSWRVVVRASRSAHPTLRELFQSKTWAYSFVWPNMTLLLGGSWPPI